MSINDAIDAVATCVKCGRTKRGGCDCYVKCDCGWLKDRGTPGCQRCVAVERTKVGPGHFIAHPSTKVGLSVVTVRKAGIHWRFTIKCGCGCNYTVEDAREFGTGKDALSVGIGQAFKMLDDGPPGELS